ncbi:MAG TPA: DUF1579 domain-containing protein [Anaerolineales bacterium]|nr:DUF1579 domain-containing protein [Anaerolineales bacterium]
MTFEGSNQSGSPHHFLAQLKGGWSGTSRLWFEPDKLADNSPVVGNIQLILDGRFALYLYQGSVQGEPQHGVFTFGYNTTLDRYEASWVDSFHNNTAIMFCTGNATDDGFFVLGSYPDPNGGPDWGWRTEVELVDEDHLVITAYNIMPEGYETKATEATLTRIKG